jgi:pimeloyl-ACP methyl ester carboxylesterase
LPYPIIFIHGLNSSSLAWQEQRTAFENLGLTYGGIFRACLNYNGSNYSSNKLQYPAQGADIAYWDAALNQTPADFYIVNFDIDNYGRVRTDPEFVDVLSNESAIAKQGFALRRIVAQVLLITGRNKVVLMGHSMGGLAAREYVQNPSNWQPDGQHHVAKLVTTGTPHGGYEGLGLSPDIDFQSEAFRDLKTTYNFGGNGVYLFGGWESYSVMNNNLVYDFYNVDVNCNGIDADGLYLSQYRITEMELSRCTMPI